MSAANYNFEIEKGTSFVIAFQYRDSSNVPINLTNWCARLRWIDDIGVTGIFQTSTVNENYSFTLDPLDGKIIFKIPAIKTAELTWSTAKYDLDLQEPVDLYGSTLEENKKVYRILEGTISTIVKNVEGYDPFVCVNDGTNSCRTCE
jgi:hypothetical protein